MGLLDDIIDGASADGVSTTNLLRKVQTIAHRIGASDLREWVKAELNGYEDDAALPTYRGPYDALVTAVWSGPFNSSATSTLPSAGTPAHFEPLFRLSFRQPLPELEALSSQSKELSQPWNGYAIGEYNRLIASNQVPRFEMMGLYSARRVITPALLKGISESIRTRALELALDLQEANPQAGEVNGPTRDDPAIDQALTVNITHIYGDGANVAQGTGITQTSKVSKGDLSGLVRAVQDLVNDPEKAREAVAIITSDETEPEKRSKLQRLGTALGSGATTLAGGVASNVTASGLIELAGQFLGW